MAGERPQFLLVFAIFACLTGSSYGASQYFGKFLGKLSELHHGVSGEIYAVDARTLHIKDFTYDGEGPAAYFWAGSTRSPGANGFRVRDENGSPAVLKRYRRKSITITLPEGKSLNNIKWFSVWCEEFAVNFGDVKIPRGFDYPKPQKIDVLRGVHGVSSDNVVIVDAQTLLIPNFSYDGEAPDAKFWVGRGSKPSPQGIRVPDENGKEIPLRRYDRKTVVLTLPGDLTVFDIGHFGVWCEAFTVDFGHVRIPQQLNIPPSLKMLGVSPQSKLNCEVLFDDLAFEVRWAVAGESIVLQLVAKLENDEYMSFGLSGDDSKTQMIGGDVVVAWVDKVTLKGYAEDYFLEAKSQCSGPRGSCPDERLTENTNNIRLLNAAMVNGYSIVTYQRPLKPSDEFDRQILTNQSQAIIWAIGPLNQRSEVSFHTQFTKKDHFIDFGRSASWNCPMPESDSAPQQSQSPATIQTPPPPQPHRKPEHVEEENYQFETSTRGKGTERRRGGNREVSERRRVSNDRQQMSSDNRSQVRRRGSSDRGTLSAVSSTSRSVPTPKPVSNRNAWHIPPIQCYEPDDGVFYAQMGPTGGKRGYPAITGHVGWGISWYINGLLIPEINVVRGKTYTFVVEGGLDQEVPAKYHPFYITDDSIGGYEYKTPEERQNVRIFAGAKQTRDGKVFPTGVGRLCHWTHTGDKEADEFQSFGAFQRTLELRCDEGEPGVITWTPDENTPDTVYYQCFTHRYLGWKINVLDSCDVRAEASEPEPALALPDSQMSDNGDLKSSSSIIVETRINPNDLFQTTQTKQISDTAASVKGELGFHQLGQDVIAFETYSKSQFQSNPELFLVPTGHAPFKIVDEIENRTTSNASNSGTADINTSSAIIPNSTATTSIKYHSTPMPAPDSFRRPMKPAYGGNKMLIRRPVSSNRPPFIIKPIMVSLHRPPPMLALNKKSFYRIPIHKRPVMRPRPKPISHEPIMIMKYQQISSKPTLQPNKQKIDIPTTMQSTVSKEKETVPNKTISSELISVKKEIDELSTMRPAINTGFHPESVVIEGGFKPIITKEFQERMTEDTEETEQQQGIGVIKLNSEKIEINQQSNEPFEPMFIPSPPDSHLLQNKKQNITKYSKRYHMMKKNPSVMYIVKHVARSAEFVQDSETESSDDEVAMAAERVEAYYLPPEDKNIKPVQKVRKPSNIDIPPGTVVTFDGKTVSGVSLTAPFIEPGTFESRSSKATELLRLSPQFGPFRGEIPPLEPQNINIASLPQLSGHAVINRDLNAPAAAPSPGTHTTRLSPVRLYQRNIRTKRSAHHTPEHTAEQNRQKQHNNNTVEKKNCSSNIACNYNFIFVIVFNIIIKYYF